MTNTQSVFLPPRVQTRVCQALKLQCAPDQLPPEHAKAIEAMWRVRNNAPEDKLDAIDWNIEMTAITGWTLLARDRILTRLGKRRIVSKDEAAQIIREIAPSEERPDSIADRLAERGNITIWSPDGAGTMRYDQPGTISHTPTLLLVAMGVRLPSFWPCRRKVRVLRVRG